MLSSNPPGLIVLKAMEPDEQAVAEDRAALIASLAGILGAPVTGPLTLPRSMRPGGASIAWASSNTRAVEIDGTVRRPAFIEGDAKAVLTATITSNARSATADFALIVSREDPDDAGALAVAAAALAIGFGPGDSASHVTRDLTLPDSGAYGSAITWSADPPLVDGDGTVNLPANSDGDAPVKLTATVSKGAATPVQRSFDLLIVRQPDTEAAAAAADAAVLAIGFGPGDTEGRVTGSLSLPVRGPCGSDIAWASSHQDLVPIGTPGSAVQVNRPPFQAGDTDVTLTATVTKGHVSASRSFALRIASQDPGDDEAVTGDANALAIGFATGDNAARVTCNLVLPDKGSYGSCFSWASDRPEIIDVHGNVHRPDLSAGDVIVSLTALIARGVASPARKHFALTVTGQTDAEAVQATRAALTIAVDPAEDVSRVTRDFTLPAKRQCGITIAWVSDNPAIVIGPGPDSSSVTASVRRPAVTASDVSVTLTATIRKGSARTTRVFSSEHFLDRDPLEPDRLTIVLGDADICSQLSDNVVESCAGLLGLDGRTARPAAADGSFADCPVEGPR